MKTNHRRRQREFGFKYYDQFIRQCGGSELEEQLINSIFKKGKKGDHKNPRRFQDIGINENEEYESSIAIDEAENEMNILSVDHEIPWIMGNTY